MHQTLGNYNIVLKVQEIKQEPLIENKPI